jgi:beta-mannanase
MGEYMKKSNLIFKLSSIIFLLLLSISINGLAEAGNRFLTKESLWDFLNSLPSKSSKKVLSGQFIGYADEAETGIDTYVNNNKLKVAMIGTDLGFNDSGDFTDVIKVVSDYWDSGGLVTISWHAWNPFTDNRDPRVNDLFHVTHNVSDLIGWSHESDNPTGAAGIWKAKLDEIAGVLQELKKRNVIVLWRPFHEMNGNWFWWGFQNQSDFMALWQHMYYYFRDEKDLNNNLLWVYAPNATINNKSIKPATFYYKYKEAGKEVTLKDVVDVVGVDKYLYDPADDKLEGYDKLTQLGKPSALTEFGPEKPDFCYDRDGTYDYYTGLLNILKKNNEITYFQAWNCQWSLKKNNNADSLLNDNLIITLEDLGLVAYYRFNGDANDASGNGNNGTVVGAILTKDRFGKKDSAYNFLGNASSYIQVPRSASIEPQNALSISFWMLRRANGSQSETVIRKTANCGPGYLVWDIATRFTAKIDGNGACWGEASPIVLDISSYLNTWAFYTFVYDTTNGGKFYINGIQKGSSPPLGPTIYHSGDLFIGGSTVTGGDGGVNGVLDDVRIYNRALSDSEVQALYTK